MPNKFIKKMVAFTVFSLTIVPAQFAQAQVVLANPDQLIYNVQHAQSVDFSMDVDVGTSTNSVHIDLDGVSGNRQAAFEAGLFSTDKNDHKESRQSSVVITPDTLYFSEDSVWYAIQQNAGTALPTEKELTDGAANFKSYMQDMFNRGVFTYQMESVDFVNGTMAVRYGYTVNSEKLVQYLLDKKAITSYQATEARSSMKNVTIGGQFWVDTAVMLPVKFTLNANGTVNGTENINVQVVISFKSFNQPVTITVPKNVISFEQYHAVAPVVTSIPVAAPVITTTTVTVNPNTDTDSDGLTDADEKNVWHSDPNSSDTDGDGYADKTEVINGYNPNGSGKLDSDSDGLTDYTEMYLYHTDRFNSDSDGDSYPDGLEVANGYSPIGSGRM